MIQVELPYPAKILWPNGRGHHMAKHREFQKHKKWAHLALRAELGPDFKPLEHALIVWSATFYPKTRHKVDDDNARASLKAYQDGLAAALGVNDILFAAPRIHFAEPVKNGRVVISIGEG
jgi:crossover junction endodeoxyribonuclease RusA